MVPFTVRGDPGNGGCGLESACAVDGAEWAIALIIQRPAGPRRTGRMPGLRHPAQQSITPTGIVVNCQNEKSQLQNKVSAMRVLEAKLLERKRLEERAELDALKGDGGSSWGNQMRSYVLRPYQMVKDLRTDYEVGNPQGVLDGDIDGFIEAGIRWRKNHEQTPA